MKTIKKEKKDYRKPRRISNGVSITIDVIDVAKASDTGLSVIGITSTSGIHYYSIPTFINKFKVSYSTISRNIEKFRYHPESHNYFLKLNDKNYVSLGIISRKRHTKRFSNDEMAEWLHCYSWNITGTVSYSDTNSLMTVRRTMERLFKRIKHKYFSQPLIFFFVTEPNPSGLGYHNHFVLGYRDEIGFSEVKQFINGILKADKAGNKTNTKIEEYMSSKKFIEYMLKDIHICPDGYDLLSNHLLN